MIRMMCDADAPALAQLFLEARRRTFYWVDPSRFQLDDFVHQTEGEQIWVAEQNRRLCGFIAIWAEENFVHHLYVDEACHGQGLGRALLAQGLADATQPASLKVATRNVQALAFYHRLGWQETDEMGVCNITGPWRRLVLPISLHFLNPRR